MPRVLAIDPGTKCGYCMMDLHPPIPAALRATRQFAGVWDLHPKRFEGCGMRYLRLIKYMTEVAPDLVVYEQVNFPHKSTCAAEVYWGIVGTITTFCESKNIPYAGIVTSEVKKRATGKGGGKGTDKAGMTKAANEYFMVTPPLKESAAATNADHNIADAMWIMQIALEEYGPFLSDKDKLMRALGRECEPKSTGANGSGEAERTVEGTNG